MPKVRRQKIKDPIAKFENLYKQYIKRREVSLSVNPDIIKELNIPKTDNCVEFKHFPLNDSGYPMYKGMTVISYLRKTSTRKDYKYKATCHKCNNKLCVNPLHLYYGTVRDNWIDFVRSYGIFDYNLFFKTKSYDFKALNKKLEELKAKKVGSCEIIKFNKN